MIVSLDIGLTTGFAIKSKHGFSHGLYRFNKDRYGAFSRWITVLLEQSTDEADPITFAVEMPHGGYFNANRVLFGFIGILESLVDPSKISYYSPKSIKKWWAGNGNADKELMKKFTKKKMKREIKDHNESDAIALFYYHQNQTKGL